MKTRILFLLYLGGNDGKLNGEATRGSHWRVGGKLDEGNVVGPQVYIKLVWLAGGVFRYILVAEYLTETNAFQIIRTFATDW